MMQNSAPPHSHLLRRPGKLKDHYVVRSSQGNTSKSSGIPWNRKSFVFERHGFGLQTQHLVSAVLALLPTCVLIDVCMKNCFVVEKEAFIFFPCPLKRSAHEFRYKLV